MTVPLLSLPRSTAGPRRARRTRRRRRLLLFLLLGLLALPGVTTSLISILHLRDWADISPDAWAADIDVQAEPAMLMTVSGMLPGDRHGGSLSVANLGASTLRYALTSVSTDPDGRGLRDVLVAELRLGSDASSGCARFDGELLYSGPLIDAAFGDPAAGQHGGDRLLGPAQREVLCVRVTLPEEVGNRHQRSATAATFTVVAEHAVVGP